MIDYKTILRIIESFYARATRDILIGYHFRGIADFDSHIPRIASFWQLQLTMQITHKERLPFRLLEVHKPLGIKTGELGRWMTLFEETLDEGIQKGELKLSEKELWMQKARFFRNKLHEKLIQPSEH